MRFWLSVIAVFCFLITSGLCVYSPTTGKASEIFRPYLLEEIDKCNRHLQQLREANALEINALREKYKDARRHYKHIEFVVEYFSPKEAKYYINGPLVPKFDGDISNEVFYPQGFQKIEEILYGEDTSHLYRVKDEAKLLEDHLKDLREYYKYVELSDGQILEMIQIELFRIASLNLNGYDATISLDGIRETEWVLEGLEYTLNAFKSLSDKGGKIKSFLDQSQNHLRKGKAAIKRNKDFNSFDRLAFITTIINPLNRSIVGLHNTLELPWSNRKQALKLNSPSLFTRNNFNLQYFSIYYEDTLFNATQAALGKLLFFDPLLSGNNNMACASCHKPENGFADSRTLSISNGLTKADVRNTPSLINVAFQKSFFYDGRAYQLEQQVFDVIHNKNEMHSTIEEVAEKLNQSQEYRMLFAKAFPEGSKGISGYNIQKAISEYEKTLVSFNSPFDEYLMGNTKKVSKEVIEGYNLFAGKALCGSCHFFPVFNGAVPPFYNDSEFEVLGVPSSANSKMIDPDKGRYNVTGVKEFMYAFKTPTVRNITITAPYMHNGIYTTLEEVLDFYHKGGGAGVGIQIENQTLPFDSLDLNNYERSAIIKFLQSLTDTIGINSRPVRLPAVEGNDVLIRKTNMY